MNEIQQAAQATVAKIMAETTPLDRGAFEVYQDKPFEFDWAWEGKPGQSDYTYQRREIKAVREARETKASKGSSSKGSARRSLANTAYPCPRCLPSHTVLAPCATA